MSIGGLVVLAVAWVLIAILIFRMHAFLALLLTALMVATLTPQAELKRFAAARLDDGKFNAQQVDSFVQSAATTRVTAAFGQTAGSIGVVIALASVIGALMLHSGAAATIVEAMLRWTGPRRAPEALAAGSFVLGIPVFFDTVFYLMMPIARGLRIRLGKDYVLYILAIFAGGAIAHSLIPPTPGPLQVAELLDIDVGVMLIAGLVIGSITSGVSLVVARLINRRVDLPLRNVDGVDESTDASGTVGPETEGPPAGVIQTRTPPPLWLSLLPIVVPVLLLAMRSILPALGWRGVVVDVVSALGEKNLALGLGTLAATVLLPWIVVEKRRSVIAGAIAAAGSVILITSAGGALGKMLYQAGIAEAVGGIADGVPGLLLLPLAWSVTASIRTLQGSATIAMITSASILQGLAMSESLPFHPVYLAMAIGGGSKPISWMTDSGFWIIAEMCGMTEREGLRTISIMSLAMGLAALLTTMAAAMIFPGLEINADVQP